MEQMQLQLIGAREPGISYVIVKTIKRSWFQPQSFHKDGSPHYDYNDRCEQCNDNIGFGGGIITRRVMQTVKQETIQAVTDDASVADEWVKRQTKTWLGIDEKTPIYDKWDRDPEAKTKYESKCEILKVPKLIIDGTIITLGVKKE